MPNQYPIVNPWEGLQGGLQDFTKTMLQVRQMRLQEEEAATQKLYRERQLQQMDMEAEEARRKQSYLGELGKLPSQPGYVRGLSESGLAGRWGYDPMPGLAQYKTDKEIEEGIQTGLTDKIYSSVAGKAGEPEDFDWRKSAGVDPETTWKDFTKPFKAIAPNVLVTEPQPTPFGTMQSVRFTKAPGSKEWKHDWQDWKSDKTDVAGGAGKKSDEFSRDDYLKYKKEVVKYEALDNALSKSKIDEVLIRDMAVRNPNDQFMQTLASSLGNPAALKRARDQIKDLLIDYRGLVRVYKATGGTMNELREPKTTAQALEWGYTRVPGMTDKSGKWVYSIPDPVTQQPRYWSSSPGK